MDSCIGGIAPFPGEATDADKCLGCAREAADDDAESGCEGRVLRRGGGVGGGPRELIRDVCSWACEEKLLARPCKASPAKFSSERSVAEDNEEVGEELKAAANTLSSYISEEGQSIHARG